MNDPLFGSRITLLEHTTLYRKKSTCLFLLLITLLTKRTKGRDDEQYQRAHNYDLFDDIILIRRIKVNLH